MRFSHEKILKFTAGSTLWLIRTGLTATAAYAISMALYNSTYIDTLDSYTQSIFAGRSARMRKMSRLWPPFHNWYLWVLHAVALMVIFGRFAKEEYLVETAKRLGILKQSPSPPQSVGLSAVLCFCVALATYQFLLPMIRLAEMHPVVLAFDFLYMLAVAAVGKITIRATSFSLKTKVE